MFRGSVKAPSEPLQDILFVLADELFNVEGRHVLVNVWQRNKNSSSVFALLPSLVCQQLLVCSLLVNRTQLNLGSILKGAFGLEQFEQLYVDWEGADHERRRDRNAVVHQV